MTRGSSSQINAAVRIFGQPDDLDPTDNVNTETTPIERRVGKVVAPLGHLLFWT